MEFVKFFDIEFDFLWFKLKGYNFCNNNIFRFKIFVYFNLECREKSESLWVLVLVWVLVYVFCIVKNLKLYYIVILDVRMCDNIEKNILFFFVVRIFFFLKI